MVFSNVAQLVVVDKQVAHPLRDWMLENGNNLVQHFEKIKEKYVTLAVFYVSYLLKFNEIL